jgi:hypothetical protein
VLDGLGQREDREALADTLLRDLERLGDALAGVACVGDEPLIALGLLEDVELDAEVVGQHGLQEQAAGVGRVAVALDERGHGGQARLAGGSEAALAVDDLVGVGALGMRLDEDRVREAARLDRVDEARLVGRVEPAAGLWPSATVIASVGARAGASCPPLVGR